MCTLINEEDTQRLKKNLKKTGNLAWKVVVVDIETGVLSAPLMGNDYYEKQFNRTNENISRYRGYKRDIQGALRGGVFHLCRTREDARLMFSIIKDSGMFIIDRWCYNMSANKKLKIMRVSYNKKDFRGIGKSVNFSTTAQRELNKMGNNAICVRAFKFVK